MPRDKTKELLRAINFMEAPSYEAVSVKLQGNTKSPEKVHNLRQRRAPLQPSDVMEEAIHKNTTQKNDTQKNSKKVIQKKNNNTRKKKSESESESEQSQYLRELLEYKKRKFDGMNAQDKYGLNKAIEYLKEEEEE